MIGIVLVSHSHLLAQGLKEVVTQITNNSVKVAAAGGLDEVTMGTDAHRIYQAIQEVYAPEGVLVLLDLRNALLSTQVAMGMLPSEQQAHVTLSSAPFVEGALVATVEASLGRNLAEINAAAEAAKTMKTPYSLETAALPSTPNGQTTDIGSTTAASFSATPD
jgi:phosphocarrier protein FPr